MSQINRSDFIYTALFCEENIWHLADSLIRQGVNHSDLNVVFISNKKQQVAIFDQQSASNILPVIWDYHVVLLRKTEAGYFIYDFDTKAELGIAVKQYIELSFPHNKNIPAPYQAQFRLIDSHTYINQFSSDRSHMLGIIKTDKFPAYPTIQVKENQPAIFLKQLINVNTPLTDNETTFSLEQFKDQFFKNKSPYQ